MSPSQQAMLVDYCPHCLNAGGVAAVRIPGQAWPAGHHGICGDNWALAQPRPHEAGGRHYTGTIGGVYEEGAVIPITVTVTTSHSGDWSFRICKIQGGGIAEETAQLTENCLNEHVLTQAAVPGAQNPGDRWYHTGSSGAGTYTFNYQLPAGLNCDGVTTKCVMQWYWLTGNSCLPPGEPAQWVLDPTMATCGVAQGYPEEFFNCADIVIKASGAEQKETLPASLSSAGACAGICSRPG
ncbi:hypothetical protein QBZ16_003945 [Prototheca wickerhamii]|uniref:Chitin-binding type-4 domain-containing protein n=1 Tax=Prototheca wickerhamii TaxID=3111 RepID=A0AAD9MIA0_PROWI|nr:hypothetical protein QBZ16_003945 [Prototheca wickerhamii]